MSNVFEYVTHAKDPMEVYPGSPMEENWLNVMGAAGWHLVSVVLRSSSAMIYYFKREKK